jgi:pSer/pThr/pTyr-binding forkhead associated (FHA) protein
MYIRDVKSSNGTFVNGERLSQEGVESEPYELKSEDTVVSRLSSNIEHRSTQLR